MFEQGSHLIDLLVRLMGRPTNVRSVLQRLSDDDLQDNCVAVFEWPRALGVITVAVLQPNFERHRSLDILGTNGTAMMRPIEPASLCIDLAQAAGPYQRGFQQVAVPEYHRFEQEFDEMACCLENGSPLPITPEQDLAVQQTLLEASGMA